MFVFLTTLSHNIQRFSQFLIFQINEQFSNDFQFVKKG